jgi:Fungal chitosanase of glycosyl hydrolase group 75
MQRKLKAAIVAVGLLSTALLATPALAASGPSASQLLAKVTSCSVVSHGKYATDDGESSTVNICKQGSAFFWKADMDIDCDGVHTSNCNEDTDPWYQDQTSFETSEGRPFQADSTHYFVIPLPSSRFSYSSNGITPGSVAAIIYSNKVVYAVFADEGPNNIIGEASYATARALGIDSNPETGGAGSGVTYIVFPGKVPSPIESNSAIDSKGIAAANTFVNG